MNINPYDNKFAEIKSIDDLTEEELKSGDWAPIDCEEQMWGKLQKALFEEFAPLKDTSQDEMKKKFNKIQDKINKAVLGIKQDD